MNTIKIFKSHLMFTICVLTRGTLYKRGVKVKILTLDIEDEDTVKSFHRMLYSGYRTLEDTIIRYRNRQTVFDDYKDKTGNVEYAVSSRIIPMSIYAVDVFEQSKNSFILIENYLHDNEQLEDTIAYIIKPNHFYFQTMKTQIELLWNSRNQSQKTSDGSQ